MIQQKVKTTDNNYKLRVQDISSVCAYLTEAFTIVGIQEKEESYEEYFYFDNYETWEKIISRINKFKTQITLSKYEEQEHDELDNFLINNLNKCDYCCLHCATCNSLKIQYGKKYNDNVIYCDKFNRRVIE